MLAKTLTLTYQHQVATYSTIEAVGHFDLSPFPEIQAWFEKVKAEIPDYEEVNGKGAADMGKWYATVTGKKWRIAMKYHYLFSSTYNCILSSPIFEQFKYSDFQWFEIKFQWFET